MKLRLCYASAQAVEKALQESLIHVAELRLALRIGGKSYYLYIHYGENGEQRHCEPLRLYAPADVSEAEVKRIKAKAKGIEGMKCVHGITIDNSTFVYDKKGLDIDEKTAELKLTGVKLVENKKQ
ncbi:MAG: hypothetical protein J6J20_03045 [Muribaculaceae bacterium]|nr:hypothetical protein [Prevotella sp.]MBP3638845.1 hypothetical protein [Muribaculaceae bacterium]